MPPKSDANERVLDLGRTESAGSTANSTVMTTNRPGMRQIAASEERAPVPVSQEVVVAYDGQSELTTRFVEIRTHVQLQWMSGGLPEHRLISVISPRRRDGRSFVAANLAVSFTKMGLRTLLIDADLRHGRMHELFTFDQRDGLSTALQRSLSEVVVSEVAGVPNLCVIGCGPKVPNPGDLISQKAFAMLLASSASNFDVVIVDTPSAIEAPEARIVASLTRASVIVSRKDRTKLDELRKLVADVRSLGSTSVGTVLLPR
jgi:receptor protein-tyrosine kinase